MECMIENFIQGSFLDDLSGIHNSHPVTRLCYDTQIMITDVFFFSFSSLIR